jgi:uncharacterized delta-60 repeat protein
MKNKLNLLVQVILALGICLSLLGGVSTPVEAQSALDGFNPNANDGVTTLSVREDGKILVGGYFTRMGEMDHNHIAQINPDGSIDHAFNTDVNGVVFALAVQLDGKILVGGNFSQVNGFERNNIARLNQNGSLDETFVLNVNDIVRVITLQSDGKILVGGVFTNVGDEEHYRIARLNTDGSLDNSFTPYANGSVQALVVQSDGKILVGGGFNELCGQKRSIIARLNTDGTLDESFIPDDEGFEKMGQTLVVQPDGKILVAGYFSELAGVIRNNIARLHPDGSLDETFNPGTDGWVWKMVLQADGKILIGGVFTHVGAEERNQIARLNPDGSLDVGFTPHSDSTIRALATQTDGKIIMGGLFTIINGINRNRIARLYPDGSLDADLNPGADDAVMALAVQADGKILLGGPFTLVDGVARNHIARLHPDGSLDIDFNPDVDGNVWAIALQPDGKIILGGSFTHVGGVERSNIGRLHPNGSLDETFNPGTNGNVFALALQSDGMVLVGGGFTELGGVTRNRIGRLDSGGGLDGTFSPNINSTVYTIAVQADHKILVGGYFTEINGQVRNHIARLESSGSLDSGFTPDAYEPVFTLAVQADHKILVGGSFFNINGHDYFARLTPDGDIDDAFNPVVNSNVQSIAVQADGKILVGGYFLSVGGQSRKRIARLDQYGNLDQDFDPNADNIVRAIALQPDGKIIIGGAFTQVGGLSRSKLARLSNNTPALQTFAVDALGKAITWHLSGASPEVWRVTFESSTNGTTYIPLGHATRSPEGWHLDGLKLPKQQDLWIRARGFYGTGFYNGSGAVLESVFYVFAPPVIHYAKPQATGTSDCLSWDNACTLITALSSAISGDQIWVKAGVHYPGTQIESSFHLRDGISVFGGFDGTESKLNQRDWHNNVTILSGDVDRNDINNDGNFIAETTDDIIGENARHVVEAYSLGNNTKLDGFVITGGLAHDEIASYSIGAGMDVFTSTLTISNILFIGNEASKGGGIYNYESNPTLINVTFSGNKAGSGGGMLNKFYSYPTLINVTFNGNSATNNGGGMYNDYRSDPTLINVTFNGNSATNIGGGVYNAQISVPSLANVIMWGNNATSSPEIHNETYANSIIAFSDVQGCGGSSAWNTACGDDGGGNIDADPRFIDAEHGNLRLGSNSPAIDAGDNSAVPAGILTDLDGNPRFVDIATIPDTGFGDPPIVDMGAFEAQSFDLAPTITSADNTSFMIGTPGTFTVTTTGYPTPTISKTGSLPSGVTFTDNGDGTATLAGTPAAGTAGDYVIDITANNGVSPNVTQEFTLTVVPAPTAPAITSADNTTFTVGTSGTFTVTTTGYPTPTINKTGALPSGVIFTDNGDGTATLAGTPAAATAGDYVFDITASNGVEPNATQTFTLTVVPAPTAPAITSANNTTFTIGKYGTFTITTSGYPTPDTIWYTGSLGDGVQFTNNGDGTATLAGTPAAGTAGDYPLALTASNGIEPNATQAFTLTVVPAQVAPAISSADNSTFMVGTNGTFTITTTGYPTPTIRKTGELPSGVTFIDNGDSTATLAGTPAAGTAGDYVIEITASNGVSPNATQTFTLTVVPAPTAPAITSANNTTFTIGKYGTFTITTSGYPTPDTIWYTGSLGDGVQFTNNGDGTATIDGIPGPNSDAEYVLVIYASNEVEPNATQIFTLMIRQPGNGFSIFLPLILR